MLRCAALRCITLACLTGLSLHSLQAFNYTLKSLKVWGPYDPKQPDPLVPRAPARFCQAR